MLTAKVTIVQEYLADPLHLFDDPVNVKPNVAYDVWCRLNSDPKSQYDGVSPILEIHSIEAPSESQIVLPWERRRESNPINQASSLNETSQKQQFTMQSYGLRTETREQSRESQNVRTFTVTIYTLGSKESTSSVNISASASQNSSFDHNATDSYTVSLSFKQWISEEEQRADHTSNLLSFLASIAHGDTRPPASQTSPEKILEVLRPVIRAQLDLTVSRDTQKSTIRNRECNVRKQQEIAAAEEKSPVNQRLQEQVPNKKIERVGSAKQLSEVQQETECTANTTLDLIAQLLCERLKMVQSHRKECRDGMKLYVAFANASFLSPYEGGWELFEKYY
ncbi:unnamed protein product [Anisakis simplex]|uniref:DUF3074 domain-containing protein n=1 Tax=Anisakis simplex TaxID=6269 RepID=A0A0M3IZU6_ANISI|nr:unnamed protein product [Anisakis simplex]